MATDSEKPQLSSSPFIIYPSTEEIKSGKLTSTNVEIAIRSLNEDGMVVIADTIEHSKLDFLNERMVKDAYTLQSRGENSPFNYNKGNIQQDPPPTKAYFDPSIFLNPIATQITSTYLGPHPKWTFCSGNTALPPVPDSIPQSQPTHSDADFAHPTKPFALVINVPLVTMTPENGSTEVWLGTHTDSGPHVQEGRHGERASGRIMLDLLEDRRKVRPPSQPVVPKGAIVVRDLRLWHGGKPNLSDEVRVMLAMSISFPPLMIHFVIKVLIPFVGWVVHFAPWYKNPMRLELSEEVKEVVEKYGVGLEIPVDWSSEEKVEGDYLDRGFGNSYFFDQVV